MKGPAAREGDVVEGLERALLRHSPPGTPAQPGGGPSTGVPVEIHQLLLPVEGSLTAALSADVLIEGRPAARVGSLAKTALEGDLPQQHQLIAPLSGRALVLTGSGSVLIHGQPAARQGDTLLMGQNVSADPHGFVKTGSSTVIIGD